MKRNIPANSLCDRDRFGEPTTKEIAEAKPEISDNPNHKRWIIWIRNQTRDYIIGLCDGEWQINQASSYPTQAGAQVALEHAQRVAGVYPCPIPKHERCECVEGDPDLLPVDILIGYANLKCAPITPLDREYTWYYRTDCEHKCDHGRIINGDRR